MKLRTRLIVAFILLSVVPLGAVTVYTYVSNLHALREAAAREADLLASELGQRMQLVTAQLTERVEHLMEMTEPESVAATTPAAASQPGAAAGAGDQVSALGRQVADVIGEAAMLLNSVQVRGLRGRGRPPGGAPPAAGEQPASPPSGAPGTTAGARAAPPPDVPRLSPDMSQAPRFRPGPGTGRGRGDQPQAGEGSGQFTLDLTRIRREMYREILPEGQQFDQLTPEQRQQIARQVNERMLGIVEGIRLGAAELQKRADEAKRKAEAEAAAAAKAAAAGRTPASAPAAPVMRHAALSGSHLNVTVQQDGQVVGSVDAEVNLPNLVMTVFSTMPRAQGEVPFAVGTDGHVYARSDADRRVIESLGRVAVPDGPVGTTVLPEWIVVTTADPSGSGLRFGIARPVGDSLNDLRQTTGRNAAFGLLFIGLALVGIMPLSSRLTRNLSTLTDGVRRIAHGDYGARVNVKAHDEMGILAKAFNQMAADVEQHQRAVVGQERLKRELELGRQIQHDMLPHEPLRLGLTEIRGVSVPAREVGGDFFNYFVLPNGHVALVMGDVSGKGVGAALLMANIQASLRVRLGLGQDLSAIANEIDHEIENNTPGPVYATLFVGILDPNARELRFVNAGHHPQYVLRRAGGLLRMASMGLPVGLLAGRGYSEGRTQLGPDDLLFFYTDGCVETENAAGDMFGAERLEALLSSCGGAPPDAVLRQVESEVEAFRGSQEQADDATMMAVRVG